MAVAAHVGVDDRIAVWDPTVVDAFDCIDDETATAEYVAIVAVVVVEVAMAAVDDNDASGSALSTTDDMSRDCDQKRYL